MDEILMKQIVETVLRELKMEENAASAHTEGMDRLLVIGDLKDVPQDMAETHQLLTVDDYVQHGNIRCYQKILITGLSLTQMSDIAQGRDGSPEACAVIRGLLTGLEVCMTETAFPHRKYAGKRSSRLYEVIENNARMLQSFGIKILKESRIVSDPAPVRPPKYQAPPVEVPAGTACVNSDRLITEAIACTLAAAGEKEICLSRDAIVTPSAWDVFKQKGIHVIRGTGDGSVSHKI